MDCLKRKYLLILLLISLTICFLLFFENQKCLAEETISTYQVTIENGKIKSKSIGNIEYTNFSNIYYKYSPIDDDTIGINKILKDTSSSTFKIFNENNIEIPINTKNGYYISYLKDGAPKRCEVFNDYYLINYELDNGTNSSNNPEAFYPTSSSITLSKPQKDNYKFLGWYSDSSFNQQILSINCNSYSSNITLYAKWAKLNTININFSQTDLYTINKTKVTTISYYYHDSLNRYIFTESPFSLLQNYPEASYKINDINENPLKIFNYDYYYCLKEPYEIIYQKPTYKISYVLDDGIFLDLPYNYYTSVDDLLSLPTITKDGYEFCEWYLDEDFTKTFTNSSFVLEDIVLYAKWVPINYIDVYFQYSNYYSTFNEKVDIVSFNLASNGMLYAYSDNLFSKYNDYKADLNVQFSVYNENKEIIPITSYQGKYCSTINNGIPCEIIIEEPYYSIQYILNKNESIANQINYYKDKSELNSLLPIATKNGYKFIDWYLNEDLTNTFNHSNFIEHDLVLYPKWTQVFPIAVYYYNDSKTTPSYERVGIIEYYESLDYFYCFGDLTNKISQNNIGYYLNKYNSSSFSIVDKDENRLEETTKNGKCLSRISSGIPNKVYIYNHYTYKLFVNGEYFFEINGTSGENAIIPDNLKGFIGKNYDAINISDFTIGNRYAVYIFKGWSFVDTSDKSWFDKAEVELIDNLKYGDDKIYIKNIYAYMTFYSKISEKNSKIDYDQYIKETHGIITSSSKYSIDDLLLEHATEISSDTQLSTADKIAKALHLDESNPLIKFLDSFFTKDKESLSDIWNNIVGKVFIIFSILIIIFFYSLLLKAFISSVKNKLN